MRSDASISSAVPALEKTVSLIVKKLLITLDDDIRGSLVGVQRLLRQDTEAAGGDVGGDGGDEEGDAEGRDGEGQGRGGGGHLGPGAPPCQLATKAQTES